jgi:hypothetical protein
MARYDKYEFMGGGFRAPLNANWLDADLNKIVPVSLNASGKIVKGTAGQSGFVGIVCITGRAVDVVGKATGTNFTGNKFADDIVDVMQDGEVVELTGLIAGQRYYAAADGNSIIPASGTITGLRQIGWTVEATRMIVRCQTAPNVV